MNIEDICIGEYVRTKKQGIKRIDTIFENRTVNRYGYEIGSEWDGKLYSTIKTTDIVNHSKNKMDLLNLGDYAVFFDENLPAEYIYNIVEKDGIYNINKYENVKEEDIKSIVTKEAFKSVEYVF